MISQLVQKIQKTKAPICVGLDPMLSYIPSHIVQNAFRRFWRDIRRSCRMPVWQSIKKSLTASMI